MLLEARISAGYKGNPEVLRDFELCVEPGEIVGLVGESGSGKSTVALALMRLLEFRGGAARFPGASQAERTGRSQRHGTVLPRRAPRCGGAG